MKKRLLALLLAASMGLSLAACGSPATESPSPDPSASTEPSTTPSATPENSVVVDLAQDVLSFSAGDLAAEKSLLTVNGQEVPTSLFL